MTKSTSENTQSLASKFKTWIANPQVWGFFVSIAVMAIISYAFFYPDNSMGNSLRQYDMQQGEANGHEAQQYEAQTGEKALWTNSLFSGMPTFQISPTYSTNSLFTWINSIYGLGLPNPSNLLFMMMMGFFILLYVMKMRWYYALIGAITWGFSSYFVIIIGAGHIWKFIALSYIPPTIAGLILAYRGRYLAGCAITGVFAMMQLNANHPQMSYYFFFVMAGLSIGYLVSAIKHGTIKQWLAGTGTIAVAGLLALGANSPSLYHTYKYANETKRTSSELTQVTNNSQEEPQERPTGGLPKSDIVGWSYGGSESFSLLIPNIKGGATMRPEQGGNVGMTLDRLDSAKNLSSDQSQFVSYFTQYFNDSEGTNGPVYVGALICALFLLGFLIVDGPTKWVLTVLTVLSILLALGRNFETLTDFMIYNFPLYNKFRAVESILVIAEFTMPLLAIMALQKLFTTEGAWAKYKKEIIIAFGIPVVICLVAIAVPSFFGSAITSQDQSTSEQIMAQIQQMGQQSGYTQSDIDNYKYQFSLSNPSNVEALESLRYGMVKSDAWRSLLIVLLGGGVILAFFNKKISRPIAVAGVGVIIVGDLYLVDKRYVSHSSFCTPEVTVSDPFAPDAADRAILADKDMNYRVMDVPNFGHPARSYHHKMIGGYHAAKLNRYEDLIQRRMAYVRTAGYDPALRLDSVVAQYRPEDQEIIKEYRADYQVMDMLNARYIINPDGNVIKNTSAMGNAWLVNDIKYVKNADEEMDALGNTDLRHTAVADAKFKDILGSDKLQPVSSSDSIYETSYSPNTLTYKVSTANDALAVFSEVYFPWGWKATIDGQPAEVGRVNYVLRAIKVPAGKHDISMTFDPDSMHTTATIAYVSIILIYLLSLAAIIMETRRCKYAEL